MNWDIFFKLGCVLFDRVSVLALMVQYLSVLDVATESFIDVLLAHASFVSIKVVFFENIFLVGLALCKLNNFVGLVSSNQMLAVFSSPFVDTTFIDSSFANCN